MSETPPHSPDPDRPDVTSGDPLAGGGGAAPPSVDDTPTTEAPPPPRRFLRAREDRVLGGVCAGLAKYFGIDVTIVRIAAVALTFLGGTGLIAYAAALAFVPEDDGTGRPATEGQSRTLTVLGAVILVIAGLVLLGDGLSWFWGPVIPTVIVIGILSWVAYRLLQDREGRPPTASRIAGATLLVIAAVLAAGVAFVGAAWAAASGGGAIVAAIVIALGVAMVGVAFTRKARWLAIPALVLALPAGVVAAADIDVDGGAGSRHFRPATVSAIPDKGYELGAGELEVDLRRLDWAQSPRVELRAQLGVGHLLVLVPEDVCVTARADMGAGYVGVLGDETGGFDLDYDAGATRVAPTAARPELV
ncbi:MAG: PspC domain-containing protein, partial [Solirubrobacterales bacterium]|nr:PspC domain-containing protein [Solirubrobacterales bacterium]